MAAEKGLAVLLGMPSRGGSKGPPGKPEVDMEEDGPSPELVSAVAELRSALAGDATDEEAASALMKAVQLC